MKKTLSLIMALVIMLTSFGTGSIAFAEEAQADASIRVDFDAIEKDVKLGESVILTATAQYYNADSLVKSPAEGIEITMDKITVGKTDKDGKIVINAYTLGVFDISAKGKFAGTDIIAPHCSLNVTSSLENYVDKEIEEISKVLVAQNSTYTIDNAVTYLSYLKSGYDMSKYNDVFVKSIQDTLSKNNGKLPNTETYGFNYTMGNYAAVISILDELDYNPKNFAGVNLVEQFAALDLGDVKYQPYYYRLAVETAVNLDNFKLAKALADDLISTYYTIGKGMNYYGYSCDNTAMFITAIAPVRENYKYYINDAKKLMKSYKKESGFAYSPEFDASADSTATALMAYSALGEIDNAFDTYKALVENYEGKPGVFGNNLTLGNCLLALEYFADTIFNEDFEHPQHVNKLTSTKNATCAAKGEKIYTCVVCNEISKEEIPALPHKEVKDKAVSATYTKTGLTQGSHCSVCGTVITKQKKVAKKKPTVSKVTAGKKQFKLTWKAVNGITGYQIQYSTDKKFKKGNKTVTVKGAKKKTATVKKLKSKKKYYVRVRTYKTSKGKKIYSSWSTAKSVKTK